MKYCSRMALLFARQLSAVWILAIACSLVSCATFLTVTLDDGTVADVSKVNAVSGKVYGELTHKMPDGRVSKYHLNGEKCGSGIVQLANQESFEGDLQLDSNASNCFPKNGVYRTHDAMVYNGDFSLQGSKMLFEGEIKNARGEVLPYSKAEARLPMWNSRRPSEYSGFAFKPIIEKQSVAMVAAPDVSASIELAFWDNVKNSNNPAELNAYLQKYPNGSFNSLAKSRIATLNALAESKSQAANATKQRLVLMPLRLAEEDKALQGVMEAALVEGLQAKYKVYSGEEVAQKAKAIFDKESKTTKKDCDETRCMQDIAVAFNAELIATASVQKQSDGYFLAVKIQDIMDNTVVYSKSTPCEGCNRYAVVDKLKELVGDTSSGSQH